MGSGEYVCSGCGKRKPTDEFPPKSPSARGRPYHCRLCVAEGAKYSVRYNRALPKLIEELKTWPGVKLASERRWLLDKLRAIREEEARRRK
jgi:hypothetical protein